MRLASDSERYQRLLRITRMYCNWYLPTNKTIANQDKIRIDKLIQLIMKDVPFFQRFQGGWPIRAMMKKYLQNSVNRLKRDLRVEREATAEDADEWDVTSQSGREQSLVDEQEDNDVDIFVGDDDEEEDDNLTSNARKSRKEKSVQPRANRKQTARLDLPPEDDAMYEDSQTPYDGSALDVLGPASWDDDMHDSEVPLTPRKSKQSEDKENESPIAPEAQQAARKAKRAQHTIADSEPPSPAQKRTAPSDEDVSLPRKKMKTGSDIFRQYYQLDFWQQPGRSSSQWSGKNPEDKPRTFGSRVFASLILVPIADRMASSAIMNLLG
ncbi:hypothetical protein B0H14DRAFT_3175815 [Mycena olivaceomarginata]|nr:hypothetical protein B0H14DRAFT_3175815 [Mycena olivaceomarginata]